MRGAGILFLAACVAQIAATSAAVGAPLISGLSIGETPPSGRFIVTGSGFGSATATSLVELGGAAAFTTRWSDTEIVAFVPGMSAVGPTSVRVVTAGGTSNSVAFTVLAMPAASGHVAWRFQMDAPYGLHRQAIAANGTVYAQDVHGFLYALDAAGRLLWIYNAGNYPNGGGGEGPVALLADGTIVVVGNPLGLDVEIHAVNPDGTRRWVFTDSGSQGVIAGPSVGPDGNVYCVTDYGGRGAISLSPSGSLRWSHTGSPTIQEHGQLGEEIAFGPASSGGVANQLYCAFDERGVAPVDQLFGFTLGGSQRFASATGAQGDPLGQRQGQPAVGQDGSVYLCASASSEGWRLQAFDPSSGSRTWTHFSTGTNGLTEPSVGPDGTIYVGRNLGEIHAVRPDQSERWAHTESEIFFGPIASPANDVVLAGGRVTYGEPGWIKALGVADGSLLWTVDLPSEGGIHMIPFSRPIFTADGRRAYLSTTLPGQPSGGEYSYLYALDIDPLATTAVDEPPGTEGARHRWIAASPNPFLRAAEVSFATARREPVSVRVFDTRGRLVREVFAGQVDAGVHRCLWDGRDAAGRDMGSGIYFVRVEAQSGSVSRKIVRTR